MLKINGTIAEITGHGKLDMRDFQARKMNKAKPSEGNPLAGLCKEALGLPALETRLAAVTSRDHMTQRQHLAGAYDKLMVGALEGKTVAAVAKIRSTVRDFRPEKAAPILKETVAPTLAAIHANLAGVVRDYAATRVIPARLRLAAALAPEDVKDPAAAAVGAIQAMEIRQRLAGLDPIARAGAVAAMGRNGAVAALAAVAGDAFGVCVPAEVLASARSACLTAIGGDFLAEDAADAEAELTQLAAVSSVFFDGLAGELRAAGVHADLLTDPARPPFGQVAHQAVQIL